MPEATPSLNIIAIKDLTYSVEGYTVLSALDMDIAQGEIFGIVGGSGSGKSTLIKCMAGLLSATSGSILLNGRELVGARERQLQAMRSDIGFVFQYSALFDSMTVFENIALAPMRRLGYSRAKAGDLVKRLLNLVQLDGVEEYLPSQLSGGMAKRVGLARALALDPKVIFYDEPTSGLDPPTARSIDELIVHTKEELGVTSVVVSHDIRALSAFADRIAMLERGTIAVTGTPGEFLVSDHPLVRRFVEAERMGEHNNM